MLLYVLIKDKGRRLSLQLACTMVNRMEQDGVKSIGWNRMVLNQSVHGLYKAVLIYLYHGIPFAVRTLSTA